MLKTTVLPEVNAFSPAQMSLFVRMQSASGYVSPLSRVKAKFVSSKGAHPAQERVCGTNGWTVTQLSGFPLLWETRKHCLSPLAAQRRSHMEAVGNREADASAFVSAWKRCFLTRTQVCGTAASAGLQAGDGECSVSGRCRLNRQPRLQTLPFLLLCDVPTGFDAGPSSAPTDMKPGCFRHLVPD